MVCLSNKSVQKEIYMSDLYNFTSYFALDVLAQKGGREEQHLVR